MYKPNLQLALASSYNERGVAGRTHSQSNLEDQKKINCFYEITKNALTGAGKLSLTKRPGVTVDAANYGISTQSAYIISTVNGGAIFSSTNTSVVYSALGNDVRASDGTTTKVIFSSAAGYVPIFVDKTLLSNAETTVLQTRKDFTSAHRVFFNSSSVGAAWTEIVDADFTALVHKGKMEFMDGYVFTLDSTNKIYNSDLNSLANWTATNFVTKQIKQDYPVGLARLNNQIIAFGEETIEVFYNAGNATGSPLSSIRQLHQKIGMTSTITYNTGPYYALVLGKIYFLGRRSGGFNSVGVFVYNGSTVEKVSTSFIDKIIGENTFYSVTAVGFNGQMAIAISFDSLIGSAATWLMYFPDWNEWFEWTSQIFHPINNGSFFLGIGTKQDKVYSFGGADNWQDAGTNFTMSTQFTLPQDGHQRKRMAEFGVLGDTARSSNMLSVEFSDNDYISFINIGAIDLARDIKTLNRGGSYRQRAVRLSSTNALETRLSAFIARIE